MAKKDFKGAAAKAFLAQEADTVSEELTEEKEKVHELPLTATGGIVKLEGGMYKIPAMSEVRETKTKRVQLVFQPSLLRRVKEESERTGISMNEIVHIALRKYLEEVEQR